MIRITYILRELFRNLYRHFGTTAASFLSLALLFLLLDIFWITARTADRFYEDLLSDVRVELFLDEELSDSLATQFTAQIIGLPQVRFAEFISKERARRELTALVGLDLLVGYDSLNPLPRSVVIEPEPSAVTTESLRRLTDSLSQAHGRHDARYAQQFLEKAERSRGITLQVGLALGALILLAALISSTNSIRLMTRARAVGFRQMLLLGASKSFVSFPFMLEGFLLGGLSAAAGWAAIAYGRTRLEFSQFDIVYPSQDEIILFCVATAVLGAMSGVFGTRRLWR